jgi:hypothetical protein
MIHCIDRHDRLFAFDVAFRRAAVANGVPDLPSQALGRSLWSQFDSTALVDIYRALVARARTGKVVTVETRCDSAHLVRYVEIRIGSLSGGGVGFRSRLVAARLRLGDGERPAGEPDPADLLRLCAWCFRGEHGGGWQGIEEIVASQGLLKREHPPQITHGICDDCLAARVDELHASSVAQ